MIKFIICGLAVLMAAITSNKTEWMEEHNISPAFVFAILTVVWMAFFIWLRHFLGIELELE